MGWVLTNEREKGLVIWDYVIVSQAWYFNITDQLPKLSQASDESTS